MLFVASAFFFGTPTAQAAKIVAVIDSGVDAYHSELRGRLEPGIDLTAGDNPNDDNVGHGTAMASLIAGKQLGACADCRILPLKVTDNMNVGLNQLAAAIDIAVDARVSLIYVGAGAPETNKRLTRAIERANSASIAVVAPVGTQGLTRPLYPAAYSSVIGVAALNRDGQFFGSSNLPGDNTLYANGQDVRVADAKGGFAVVSGSSPAAATVAGLRARTIDQQLGPAKIRVAKLDAVSNDEALARLDRPVTATLQYGDTDDTDIILDAPWRTIREYLPFLVFVPEFEQSKYQKRTIQRIELHNYDRMSGAEKDIIFLDVPGGPDQTSCAGESIEIMDADGRSRETIGAQEALEEFWHYIAKIPVSCIGVGRQLGQSGEHHLLARVYWETVTNTGGKIETHSYDVHRVLRVLVGSEGFPRFDPADHYYDAHVHTIAEQTGWNGTFNVNASRKAYGGPLAMLTESAYALGLIETQLRDGNWSAFRDQLATTDHNAFYSGNPYDAGTAPGYGPTSHRHTNGKKGEFQWYRDHFGELGGEEVSLSGTGRTIHSDMTKALASHFLVYGGPHFEGPWHGGKFTVDLDAEGTGADITTAGDVVGVKNPNTMDSVLERLSQTDAFGYAAHPFSGSSGWSKDYFDRAIGLPPYFNDGRRNSRILQSNSRDFIFKGSQVWNEKHDFKSTAEMLGNNLTVSDLDHFDPFTPGNSKQRFVSNPSWAKGLNAGIAEYVEFLKRGLRYSFQQQSDHRFIRKLYMSAGTDAHGDFNYLTSLESTAVAEIYDYFHSSVDSAAASSNAFGRVRTYTLSGEKMGRFANAEVASDSSGGRRALESRLSVSALEGQVVFDDTRPGATTSGKDLRASVMAYREGNTILTDGPICKFSVDSECRFDSNKDNPQWHDSSCAWENADGRIGGEGDFDGGGSALISRGSSSVLSTIWDGRNDYIPLADGQPDEIQYAFSVHQFGLKYPTHILMDGGPRGEVQYSALPEDIRKRITERRDHSPSALMLRADLGTAENQASCITNPVWVIPAKFYYPSPPSECSIRPGELRVSIDFGVSMDSTVVDRCSSGDCLAPANGASGGYSGATIKIYPLDGAGNSVGRGINLKPRWFANNLSGPGFKKIADANLVGDNETEIACPSSDWDAETRSKKSNVKSYAVIVSNLRDMHGNELNAIADTFTVTRASRPQTPQRPTPAQSCSAAGARMCSGYGGRCEITTAIDGARNELCRWNSASSAAMCNDRTAGIWTTAGSRYAKNHPGAVSPGTPGACITEVKNLENRIQ
jgi:hypothetical protein